MTTVLWDFNGTILNDMELTLRLNNEIFAARGYRHVSMEEYRRIFRFPVHDYYMDLGVTEEDFPTVATDWAHGYEDRCTECALQPGVTEAVHALRGAGCPQVIISASREPLLRRQISLFPELDGMFGEILGLSHHYATSKVQLAKDYLARSGLAPENAVFIGDTTHDAEVAEAIGCRCLLVSGGHQCDEVLRTAGVPVVPTLRDAVVHILG